MKLADEPEHTTVLNETTQALLKNFPEWKSEVSRFVDSFYTHEEIRDDMLYTILPQKFVNDDLQEALVLMMKTMKDISRNNSDAYAYHPLLINKVLVHALECEYTVLEMQKVLLLTFLHDHIEEAYMDTYKTSPQADIESVRDGLVEIDAYFPGMGKYGIILTEPDVHYEDISVSTDKRILETCAILVQLFEVDDKIVYDMVLADKIENLTALEYVWDARNTTQQNKYDILSKKLAHCQFVLEIFENHQKGTRILRDVLRDIITFLKEAAVAILEPSIIEQNCMDEYLNTYHNMYKRYVEDSDELKEAVFEYHSLLHIRDVETMQADARKNINPYLPDESL